MPSQQAFAQASDALSQLTGKAPRLGGLGYAGEVSPQDAFAFLSVNAGALVDVRTIPEWQFTGTPNLANTPSTLLTLSWKIYPSFAQNPQFIDLLDAQAGKDMPLFFLCRSGGRSLDAAVAATAAGYAYAFNVSGGFEGEPDEAGHRGTSQGWKAANLPWAQG